MTLGSAGAVEYGRLDGKALGSELEGPQDRSHGRGGASRGGGVGGGGGWKKGRGKGGGGWAGGWERGKRKKRKEKHIRKSKGPVWSGYGKMWQAKQLMRRGEDELVSCRSPPGPTFGDRGRPGPRNVRKGYGRTNLA